MLAYKNGSGDWSGRKSLIFGPSLLTGNKLLPKTHLYPQLCVRVGVNQTEYELSAAASATYFIQKRYVRVGVYTKMSDYTGHYTVSARVIVVVLVT